MLQWHFPAYFPASRPRACSHPVAVAHVLLRDKGEAPPRPRRVRGSCYTLPLTHLTWFLDLIAVLQPLDNSSVISRGRLTGAWSIMVPGSDPSPCSCHCSSLFDNRGRGLTQSPGKDVYYCTPPKQAELVSSPASVPSFLPHTHLVALVSRRVHNKKRLLLCCTPAQRQCTRRQQPFACQNRRTGRPDPAQMYICVVGSCVCQCHNNRTSRLEAD